MGWSRTSPVGNSLLAMYSKFGDMGAARRLLFEDMPRIDNVSWNFALVAVLGACDHIIDLQFGMSVHGYLVQQRLGTSTMMGTALKDLFAKCGSIGCSCKKSDEMPEKYLVSWTVMIAGFGLHGRGKGG
ncbi:hypothetical protein HHK36_003479 [Tetracentron sinense]|uniref:Pentatricopeptide repeat-containing protein n=1 Tax=Tetracentron sinense TaxID=13715 RepID=A0A835DSI7_TETSI|nr:hypothetical protein HHK36_003479 [Tetracentron sinense]